MVACAELQSIVGGGAVAALDAPVAPAGRVMLASARVIGFSEQRAKRVRE
jgi:hypothetical protein